MSKEKKTGIPSVKKASTIMAVKKGPKLIQELYVPSSDDPCEELKKLVRQHKAVMQNEVALTNRCSDKEARQDIEQDGKIIFRKGDPMPCRLPAEVQAQALLMAKEVFGKAKEELERKMAKELKKVPIFREYLSKVFGLSSGGPIAAYLVAEIDIHRAVKPSALRRFCGMAVIDGRLERRTKGQKNSFSSEMRTRLFQFFQTLQKNRRHNPTNKYLKVWDDAKTRIRNSERVFDLKEKEGGDWAGKLVNGQGKTVSAKGFSNSYGWHKAADVFLEDLYIVWRALEGLPVWPSYYAAKLGYEHGGKIAVNAPKMLTLEEALSIVGIHEEELSAAAEE